LKILLVNMARMGDLVQTTPTALALKKELDAEITLLVTNNLEEFATRLSGVDHVISFDEDNLVPHLRKGGSLVEGYFAWQNFVTKLKKMFFDRVINLTHDAFSTRLVSSLDISEITGRFQKSEGAIQIKGSWLRYFVAVLSNRELNGINLVDIYRKGCGAGFHKQRVSMEVSLDDTLKLDTILGNIGENLVAIHPGANNEKRRYPIEYYCKLADKLVADGYDLVVLGSEKERHLAEKIVNASWGMAENLAGKIPLELLPAMLQRTRLLITNDTGPLHIAASVGIPTVSIFLAMARPEDTAPYGEGHFVFETMFHSHPCPENEPCPNPVCGESVSFESIRYVVNCVANEEQIDPNEPVMNKGEYRLLRTEFSDDEEVQVLKEIFNNSQRTDFHLAPAMRRQVLSLLDDYKYDEDSARLVMASFEYKDKEVLSKAIDLASSILQKIEGLEIQDTQGKSLSLMELENSWHELEHLSKKASFLMLPFRLERERLYANGLSFTRSEAFDRFKKWMDRVTQLIRVYDYSEVAI